MIELKGYETIGGQECYIGGVRNMLSYYKMPIDEHIIYGIGGGFKYAFERDPIFQNNKYKLHTGITLTVQNFLKTLNIQYLSEGSVENSEEAERYLVKSLSKGEPVLIGVKGAEMTYDPEFNDYPEEWNHLIVAIGIDLKHRRIKISDCYIPSTPPRIFQDWYSYDIIKKSRSKVNSWHFSIDLRSLEQHRLENKPQVLMEKHLIPRMKESIMQSLRGKTTGQSYFGVHALEAYHDFLLNLKDCNGNELEQVLYMHYIDWELKGFIDYKRYLLMAIQEISVVKNSGELKRISQKLSINCNNWKTLWLLMIKVAISKDSKKVIQLANKFKILYQRELDITSEILNYI